MTFVDLRSSRFLIASLLPSPLPFLSPCNTPPHAVFPAAWRDQLCVSRSVGRGAAGQDGQHQQTGSSSSAGRSTDAWLVSAAWCRHGSCYMPTFHLLLYLSCVRCTTFVRSLHESVSPAAYYGVFCALLMIYVCIMLVRLSLVK